MAPGAARPEMRAIVVDPGGVRSQAGQQGSSRGAARCLLAIAAKECEASASEPVNIRRVHTRTAVAAQLRPEIVDQH